MSRQYYRIKAKGIFNLKKIHIKYQTNNIEFNEEMQKEINRAWTTAQSSTPCIYNGSLVRVISCKPHGSTLSLSLEDTTYKEFVGTRTRSFRKKFGSKKTANPLTLGSLLITSDKKIVLGKRSKSVDLEKDKYALIGGYFDRDEDMINGRPNIRFALQRELTEEMKIRRHQIKRLFCMGAIYNELYKQTFLPFYCELKISSKRLDKKPSTCSEFSKFEFPDLTIDSIRRLISKNRMLSDVTLPTLVLFDKLLTEGRMAIDNQK